MSEPVRTVPLCDLEPPRYSEETRGIREYMLSDGFKKWLENNRPGIFALGKKNGIDRGVLSVGSSWRCLLRFPSLKAVDSTEFNRQYEPDQAIMVLDGHPEQLAESVRPADAGYIGKCYIGDSFHVDPLLLGQMVRANLGTARSEMATIVDRDGWNVTARLDSGLTFVIDATNLQCSPCIAWKEATKDNEAIAPA